MLKKSWKKKKQRRKKDKQITIADSILTQNQTSLAIANNCGEVKHDIRYIMKIFFGLLLFAFFACNSKEDSQKKLYTDEIDPDIILINIGQSSRTEIAALLLDIDKCSPSMIGIDVIFPKH